MHDASGMFYELIIANFVMKLFLSFAFFILHTVVEVSGEWKLLSLVMDDASTLPSNLLYHTAIPYSTYTAADVIIWFWPKKHEFFQYE